MTFVLAAIAVGFVIAACLLVEYPHLLPAPRGLRILMYHKVSEDQADDLTVKRETLERQFDHLAREDYTTVSFDTVLKSMAGGPDLPPRSVIITFDDGYRDTYTIAFPLLKRHNLKATVFLVAGRIGQTNTWDATHEPLMDAREIREMAASGLVEFGLHSYDHANYRQMTCRQMREDVVRSIQSLKELGIPFAPVLCFPYGAFPREAKTNADMRKMLADMGIRLAVRIGQRVNRLPIRDPYQLRRAIVNGNDQLFEFRVKLKMGRRRLLLL